MFNLKNNFGYIGTVLILVIIIVIVLIFGFVLFKNHKISSRSTYYSKPSISAPKKSASSLNLNNTLPTAALNCSSNLSLVPLSSDYTINAMTCVPVGSATQNQVLGCNGTIFSDQISINCYPPNNYSSLDQLACSGSIQPSPAPSISLSYNCEQVNVSNNIYYSCNGSIQNYNSFAINLNLSSSCTK